MKAAIKVTGSEPNKGRLYYACASPSSTDKCSFWDWCNPVNPTMVGHSTMVSGRRYNDDEGENEATTVGVATTVDVATTVGVERVEALQSQLSFLKKLIVICFGIIFILIMRK